MTVLTKSDIRRRIGALLEGEPKLLPCPYSCPCSIQLDKWRRDLNTLHHDLETEIYGEADHNTA